MPTKAAAVVRRLTEPALPLPLLSSAQSAAVIDLLSERYPGNPRDSVRRSVALLFEALAGLFFERDDGTYPDPHAFRFSLETIERATVELARRRGSGVRKIDLLEVRAILDALVAANVLTTIEPSDADETEDESGPILAFAALARAKR